MKKNILGFVVAIALNIGVNGTATAALDSGATLDFNAYYLDRVCSVPESVALVAPANDPSGTGCAYGIFTDVTSGSYFAMDTNGDGQWTDGTQKTGFETHKDATGAWLPEFTTLPNERYGLTPGATGISLGMGGQGAGTATYDMSDPNRVVLNSFTSGDMDAGWGFFGAAGWHTTTDANGISVATDDGAGNVTLDMSGWTVFWNGGNIDMGQGADATLKCSDTCAEIYSCGWGPEFCAELGLVDGNEGFTLDYTAVVPSGGFAGVAYQLHLEGGVAAVPVPAAVWLFGSGLIGLVGFARCKKT